MRKITKLDKFYELKSSKDFPSWVIGGMIQNAFFLDYEVSDEQKKNIEIIDSLSPITDLEKIEGLLMSGLLDIHCSICQKVYSKLAVVVEDEPYDTPEVRMCIDCIKKAFGILSI